MNLLVFSDKWSYQQQDQKKHEKPSTADLPTQRSKRDQNRSK